MMGPVHVVGLLRREAADGDDLATLCAWEANLERRIRVTGVPGRTLPRLVDALAVCPGSAAMRAWIRSRNDGRMPTRCSWPGEDPQYVAYHDEEWGVPERDPRALWECLMLEGFQAGLAWITILRKRAAFREAFAGFDPEAVAAFGAADVERLLGNAGIVRSRAKIEATIAGARLVSDMDDFAAYCWSFDDPELFSQDLRRRGFKFVGPTIVLAFMQAVGIRNDHDRECFRYAEVEALRSAA